MNCKARPAGSVENDPNATSHADITAAHASAACAAAATASTQAAALFARYSRIQQSSVGGSPPPVVATQVGVTSRAVIWTSPPSPIPTSAVRPPRGLPLALAPIAGERAV